MQRKFDCYSCRQDITCIHCSDGSSTSESQALLLTETQTTLANCNSRLHIPTPKPTSLPWLNRVPHPGEEIALKNLFLTNYDTSFLIFNPLRCMQKKFKWIPNMSFYIALLLSNANKYSVLLQ